MVKGAEMTNEEAMNLLDNLKGMLDDSQGNDYDSAFNLAIKALEKQIPINLVCIEDKFLHCPCCDEALSYKWEKYPTEKINLDWLKFCWNCGQALKWE